jgi:hypothetical protein
MDRAAEEVEHDMDVALGRFRARIGLLVGASFVLDLAAAGLALGFEHGAQDAFSTYLNALFWTTTQLLTVSSSLPNPERAATRCSTWCSRPGRWWSSPRWPGLSPTCCTTAHATARCASASAPRPDVR